MAIDRDDKIALGVIAAVGAALTLGVLIAIRWLFAGVLGVISLEDGGVGWQGAFVSAIVLSFFFVLIMAVVAGDGVIGEFGLMVIALFHPLDCDRALDQIMSVGRGPSLGPPSRGRVT
jgi:hypothetical protein